MPNSAARISAGEALGRAAPVAVVGLARFHLRSMMIRQCWTIAGLIALGITTTIGAVGLATGGDEPKPAARTDDLKPAAKAGAEHPELSLAEKLDRLKDEYESALRAHDALFRGSTIPEENRAKAAEIKPDFPAVVRRIADLAATASKDPAVRDAMLWMIHKAHSGRPDRGGFGPVAPRRSRPRGRDAL
jgi:hypothetical protein